MAGPPEHCLLFRQIRFDFREPVETSDSISTIIDESGYIPAGCGHQSPDCYHPGSFVTLTPHE
jgi:hypothetical protein